MKAYKTVDKYGEDELIEKKSRFLSFCFSIEDEQEALDYIEKFRKKYYDATHVVYAYKLKNNNIARFSDDNEPQGTAGMPVLDVINKNDLFDVIILVVRYFGGTLLGAGGLVRAYSKSAVMALDNAVICEMTPCVKFEIECPYNMLSQIQFLLNNFSCVKDDIVYTDIISLKYHIKETDFEKFQNEFTDKTEGKIGIKVLKSEFCKIKVDSNEE